MNTLTCIVVFLVSTEWALVAALYILTRTND